MLQKIIKVGNSAAVTIPKEFLKQAKIAIGQYLDVEVDPELKIIIIKTLDSPYKTKMTPEFRQWLHNFIKQNQNLLKTLKEKP